MARGGIRQEVLAGEHLPGWPLLHYDLQGNVVQIRKLYCLSALLLITASADAAQPARGKPEAVTPQAIEERLAAISKDPAKLEEAISKGKKSASFCRHCHGDGGHSAQGDVPNLASQNAAYLAEQMNKLADGRRKSEFMEGLIKALSLEERVNIAWFFASQPAPGASAVNAKQAADGKILYQKICINCHGANGAGTNKIPRVAGQQTEYLQASMKRYRSGSGERIDLQMASFTRNLKDADIENLTAYISSMP
jgi:cytochrome c553